MIVVSKQKYWNKIAAGHLAREKTNDKNCNVDTSSCMKIEVGYPYILYVKSNRSTWIHHRRSVRIEC